MTEHLPECCVGPNGCKAEPCQRCHACCICDALRACEQRMEESMDRAWAKATLEIEAHARQSALDAAREAVKGVNWFNDEGKMLSAIVATADSIAAIDALGEKP